MEKTSICINCGKYIGVKEICPYCGEEQPKPISLKFLRYLSVVIAVGGIFFLFIAAKTGKAPLVKIKDLKPTMNFAKIRIKGLVESSPYYSEERGAYLSFWITDGTGSIQVRAFKKTAKEVIEKGKYPVIGDSVDVIGTLYAQENYRLTLNKSEDLKVKILKPAIFNLNEITEKHVGKRVETIGEIRNIRELRTKALVVYITYGGKDIPVFIPHFYKNKRKILSLKKGSIIKVRGAVSLYKEKLEIIPHSIDEIEVLKEGEEEVEVKKSEKSGIFKEIKGIVLGGKVFKKGMNIFVKTEKGKRELLLWKSTLRKRKGENWKILTGSTVVFWIKEKTYKGKKEYVVRKFKVLSYPEKPVFIKNIDSKDWGKFLKIKGTISEVMEFKRGVKVNINDGTGGISIWIWKDIWEELKEKPSEGEEIVLVGEIKEYKGQLEIVPRIPEDIRIIK